MIENPIIIVVRLKWVPFYFYDLFSSVPIRELERETGWLRVDRVLSHGVSKCYEVVTLRNLWTS